jgi:transcriptional regulator with XRE-family HTH domain
MTNTSPAGKLHEGRNLKRIREMLQMKQATLANELGNDWSQKKVSQLEAKETIEPDLLDQIADILKVPAEAIRNFDQEKTIYNISCNFSDNAVNNNAINIQQIDFAEKWIQTLEENKKLYERLLQAEKEKVEMLEKMLAQAKQ